MKSLTQISVFVLAVLLVSANAYRYTSSSSRLDFIDINQILQSERAFRSYFDCLMDRGPCTPEGYEIKMALPIALQTRCQNCNEIQKKKITDVFAFLRTYKPDLYLQLLGKYDPLNESGLGSL